MSFQHGGTVGDLVTERLCTGMGDKQDKQASKQAGKQESRKAVTLAFTALFTGKSVEI